MSNVPATGRPYSLTLRNVAVSLIAAALALAGVGFYIIVQDARSADDAFHGLGYALGAIVLGISAWTTFCCVASMRRRSHNRQVMWVLLGGPVLVFTILALVTVFIPGL